VIALLQHHLSLLGLPLLGGILVGWFTTQGRTSRTGWALVAVGALILIAALAASALKIVPGEGGLLLDTALLFALVYLIGCGLGLLLRVVYLPRGSFSPTRKELSDFSRL
jgi:hypothetical protein